MWNIYRVVAFANLPRSDMIGYFRSYHVFSGIYSESVGLSTIHEHYGYNSQPPEECEGRYEIHNKTVLAKDPFHAIRKLEEWEHLGHDESYLISMLPGNITEDESNGMNIKNA